ncbi:phosphate signaling complex protein PhoU [Alkalihalobacillus sp. LMS39]|uniref:phosphate signaling complex protein PhoU n=1 Tax=Alkalihalobacillus sp. LMS39 TaxID=2924032 RepID=UPI001FB1ADDE|nr:phosphate signaling complex protein PhoU [Alkalihalobacillus sp. LMS39]UOE93280.1 phosphate signaling complex protein PhoU [Alkalihalobacillus sp. LMS39]
MEIRGNFTHQLVEVKQEIQKMGQQVKQSLSLAIEAFQQGNVMKMEKVIQGDIEINQMELAINDEVVLMIAKQQPVAGDLRKLIVALKISSDLERIGDLAVDMAKVSKRIDTNYLTGQRDVLLEMADIACNMLETSLNAYMTSDILVAQRIAMLDDKVDQMYGQYIRDIMNLGTEALRAEQTTQLAFLGRYIERIADYATNVAEWVVYEVNGKHFDLN